VIKDQGGNILSTESNIRDDLALVTTSTHHEVTFPQHCDSLREYTFKLRVLTLTGDIFKTSLIKVTSTNTALIPPTVVDTTYTDVSVETYHYLGKFTGGSPSCTIAHYRLVDYNLNMYNKDDPNLIAKTYSGEFDVDFLVSDTGS
jgi:hypothetical protein